MAPRSRSRAASVTSGATSDERTGEEVAWFTDEIPLIPLDGSPAPEGIPQHIVDQALTEHAARERDSDAE